MKTILAMLALVLMGCSSGPTEQEMKAYNAVVSDSKYGTGEQAVKDAGQDEVIADIKELCENLPNYTYRSDASNATDYKYDNLGYELSITSGVKIMCPESWANGKLMN